MHRQPTFGQRVRQLRKGKNLDQRTLAHRVAARLKVGERRGFDVTYLSKIENGRVPPPSAAAIMGLAAELATDPDELLALAGKAPTDVVQTIAESPGARTFYRSALDLDLTEEEWDELLKDLRRRKGLE